MMDDFITANPAWDFRVHVHEGHECLRGTDPQTKVVRIVFLLGDKSVLVNEDGLTKAGVKVALHNLRMSQPGQEFLTVGDDEYAADLRAIGMFVVKDNHGRAKVWREEAA